MHGADAEDLNAFWAVVSVQAPPRGEEHRLVDALRALGARAVERKDERYYALLPPPADSGRLLDRAAALIRIHTSMEDPWLILDWRSHDDWAEARIAEFEPRRVGRRIVVAAEGREPDQQAGDVVIRLAPGTAFGTAEHPTTRGCLILLEQCMEPGDTVADVGSGSGILAIATALLGAAEVVAWESDRLACAEAEANLAMNGVAGRVTLRAERVTPHNRLGRFDGVIANLPFDVLAPLLPALASATSPNGWLVVSGVVRPEVDAVRRRARASGLSPYRERVDEGWWTACLRRS